MKVNYSREEWYPIYTIAKIGDKENALDYEEGEIDIPTEKYEEYKQIMRKFAEIQDFIQAVIEEK